MSRPRASKTDYWLGQQGRITEPMVLRAGATHYEPIGWDDAFTHGRRPPPRTRLAGRGGVLHLRARRPTRRRSSTSCSSGPSAPTTCPTAPTCATSPPRSALAETIGIGKGSVSPGRRPRRRADRHRRPEPGHQPPADAERARAGQAERRQDHRGQPAARGRAGEVPQPADAARAGSGRAPRWPTCTCRSGSTATSRCSRRSASLLLEWGARRPRLRRAAHDRLRGVGGSRRRARLGRRTPRDRA